MATPDNATDNATTAAVRDLALRYPGTEIVGVCVNRAFKAGKKSFLFVGIKDTEYHFRIRLGASIAEAEGLAEKHPDNYAVGKFGWTKVTFPADEAPPPGLLERWVDESFRLLVPKKIVAELPASGPPRPPK